MTQECACHLAKECLHDVEPRSMFGCQHVLEAIGAGRQKSMGFFGNVRRMVVQNDPYSAVRRIVLVEIFEQRDEFPAAMSPFNACRNMALMQVQCRENGTCSETFVFMIAAHVRMFSRNWGAIGRGVGDG